MKREIVRLTGIVHGVGFRYRVLRIAQRFDVVGAVRNIRAPQALEIDVEGDPAEIDRFIAAVLAEPPPAGRVDASTRRDAEPRYPAAFEITSTLHE